MCLACPPAQVLRAEEDEDDEESVTLVSESLKAKGSPAGAATPRKQKEQKQKPKPQQQQQQQQQKQPAVPAGQAVTLEMVEEVRPSVDSVEWGFYVQGPSVSHFLTPHGRADIDH